MAEIQVTDGGSHNQVSGISVLVASLAGVVVGGPLLGMLGFSFLATVTLLLISSPLLIIFSPLLFCAALVLVAAMGGFAAAAAMALAGMSTFACIFRSFLAERTVREWAGYLQQKVQNQPENRD